MSLAPGRNWSKTYVSMFFPADKPRQRGFLRIRGYQGRLRLCPAGSSVQDPGRTLSKITLDHPGVQDQGSQVRENHDPVPGEERGTRTDDGSGAQDQARVGADIRISRQEGSGCQGRP